MANTDALDATGGTAMPWRKARPGPKLKGNAAMIARPAYTRLLAAEPYLRRSIPALIVIFLIVIAASRTMSLMTMREEVDRDARALIGLKAAHAAAALENATRDGRSTDDAAHLLVERLERRQDGGDAIIAVAGPSQTVMAGSGARSFAASS